MADNIRAQLQANHHNLHQQNTVMMQVRANPHNSDYIYNYFEVTPKEKCNEILKYIKC